jgi:hypothetical protein
MDTVGRMVASTFGVRGKSGLQRAHCQVMPGRYRKILTDSATERIPPMTAGYYSASGKGEMVG